MRIVVALVLSVTGALSTAISGSVLIEYLFQHPELSAWTGTVPMSSPAATCCFLLGIGQTITGLYFWKHV